MLRCLITHCFAATVTEKQGSKLASPRPFLSSNLSNGYLGRLGWAAMNVASVIKREHEFATISALKTHEGVIQILQLVQRTKRLLRAPRQCVSVIATLWRGAPNVVLFATTRMLL